MKLEVFDKHTRQRLGLIKTYTFVQYVDEFNDVGKFSLKVPYTESSLKYMKEGNYIWFEKDVVGIVKYVKELRQESTVVTIEGPLSKKLLEYRVTEKTKTYYGKHGAIVNKMVTDHFISPENLKRRMDCISVSESFPDTESTVHQSTGKPVHTSLSSFLSPVHGGLKLSPVFVNYTEEGDVSANIETFQVQTVISTNRTLGNPDGNSPVVFSVEMGNLASLMYEKDESNYYSTIYVGGEGEGQDRTVLETGDTEATDVDRIEGYSDARDIQRIQSDGTISSEEEYMSLLEKRGSEDLQLHVSSTNVQGTILDNGAFIFEEDYTLGDRVSLSDKHLDFVVDVPITAVTCSLSQNTGKIYDFSFGYKSATVKKILKTKGVL